MSSIPAEMLLGTPTLSDQLYREFRPLVLGVCYRFLGSHADAEDAAGEIFARLPRALKTFDRAQPFSRWLSTVVGHYCVDLLRRRQIERRIFQSDRPVAWEPAARDLSPLQELESRERVEKVRTAIASLPEHYRAPLVLRYYEHLTYDQIAEKLGHSRANVRSLIFRAKKQLRAALAAKDPALRKVA